MKRVAAGKKVKIQRRVKAKADAFDRLPHNATLADIKKAEANVSLAELEERVNDVRESWETDSLFEDALEELGADTSSISSGSNNGSSSNSADVCSPEEAGRLRRELREYGPTVFCQRTVDAGRYSAKKLLSAFGIRAPPFLEGESDAAYYDVLVLAISRELSKRAKLTRYNSVSDAVELLARSNNIIVITGAGISTSLGIPDFRSKGTGLYSRLEHLGLGDPQEVFDINVFREDPSIFYSVARDIVPASDRFTPTHHFIAMLHRRGKLLTNYSQNIDNLEVKAGVPRERLVQCHGSFGTASCITCGFQTDGDVIIPDIRAGTIPHCPKCAAASLAPGHQKPSAQKSASSASSYGQKPSAQKPASSSSSYGQKSSAQKSSSSSGQKRKRPARRRWSDDSTDDDESCSNNADATASSRTGVMKPDITFFGEALPAEFGDRLTQHDRDVVDLVIVIGTSLKVTPVSEIVSWLPPHIPQIYISREPVSHINFDIDLLGDCDVVVAELARRLGWPLEHDMVPPLQRVEVVTEPGAVSRHVFQAVMPEDAAAKMEFGMGGVPGGGDEYGAPSGVPKTEEAPASSRPRMTARKSCRGSCSARSSKPKS